MNLRGPELKPSALVSLFPQERQRQRAHAQADEDVRGGDAGHAVGRRLRERGHGNEKKKKGKANVFMCISQLAECKAKGKVPAQQQSIHDASRYWGNTERPWFVFPLFFFSSFSFFFFFLLSFVFFR